MKISWVLDSAVFAAKAFTAASVFLLAVGLSPFVVILFPRVEEDGILRTWAHFVVFSFRRSKELLIED